jgi:hypothetical protein
MLGVDVGGGGRVGAFSIAGVAVTRGVDVGGSVGSWLGVIDGVRVGGGVVVGGRVAVGLTGAITLSCI